MAKRLEELSKKDLMKKFGSALASGTNTNIREYTRNNTKEDVIQDIQGLGLNQGDDFLERKKGYAFMPLEERMEIINAIKGVDFVVPWETDGDQTVCGALELLRPRFFTKGGDRTDYTNIPEWDICQNIGCEIIAGVGGDKIQSSSDLVAAADGVKHAKK